MNNQTLKGAWGRRVFAGIFFLLAISCAVAQPAADPPGVKVDRSAIGEGRFRVDFELPDGIELDPAAHYLNIHVDDGAETWSFASLETRQWFSSQTPGEQRVRAEVCRSERDRRDQCGPASDEVRVRIPNAVAVVTPEPAEGGFGAASQGGPEATHPGSFRSTKTKWNAWQLMWLNSLVQLQPPDSQDPQFFDLLVRWQTYEYDPALGRYIPIWLWAQLSEPTSGTTFSGALHYRRMVNGQPVNDVIGEVEITPHPLDPETVTAQWRSNRGGMYATQVTNTWVSDTLLFADDLVPGTQPAPHDHYLGDWTTLTPSGDNDPAASIMVWIERNLETIQMLFFDDAGRPVWGRADWGGASTAPPGTGREDFCAYTVFDAIAPDTTPASGHTVTVEQLGCGGANNSNLARSYDPVGPGRDRSGSIWADLQLPAYRPGQLVLGSSSSLVPMIKLSHFHDIRTVIDGVDGKTTCVVDSGGSCTLDLRWVLEGVYPDAAVYRRALPSGSPVRIFSSIPGSEEGRAHTLPGVGQYEFQIHRTGSATSDLLARSHAIAAQSATAESPPSPVADPNFSADPASNTTGATRGEFRVAETGAAGYRIPIMTGPAGGGMAPELALSYNSQSGNGIAGLGWSLDGVSAITRCAKTPETDGVVGGVDLTSGDRFCLDGQRLVQTSGGSYGGNGTEYRLEVDQIVRVQSFGSQGGGPAYFKVWRKDGTVSWYGAIDQAGSQTGGSRVASKIAGTSSPTWSWNIGRIEDSAGNFMQFIWQDRDASGSGVETVLSRIDYSGHVAGATVLAPLHRITFEYLLRPATDRSEAFTAGALLKRHYRLSRIVSRAQGQELRRYDLDYLGAGDGTGRSVLRQVTECNGSNCFAPTVFDWHSGPHALGALSTGATPKFTVPGSEASKLVAQLPADLNGDGLNDLVFLFKNGSSNPPILKWRLALRNASGQIFFGALVSGPALGGGVRSDDNVLPKLRVIDIDADGHHDILYAANNSLNPSVTTFQLHRWNTATSQLNTAVQVGAPTTNGANNLQVLDWDGDGLSDVAYVGNPGSSALKVARNTGFNPASPATTLAAPQNFSVALSSAHFPLPPGPPTGLKEFDFANAEVIDANGDGRADLVMAVREDYTDCDGSECPAPVGDANDGSTPPGDPDPIEVSSSVSTRGRYILFEMQFIESTGEYKLVSTDVLALTEDDDAGGGFAKARDLRLTDLNADGLVDALYYNPSAARWEQKRGLGVSGFGPIRSINHWPTDEAITEHMQLADVNGDGHPDALFPSQASSSSAVWQVSLWDWSRSAGGQGNYSVLTNTTAAAGNVGSGAGSMFADFNGSGKTDQLLIVPSSGDLKYLFGAGVRAAGGIFSPTYVLKRITDGFGAWTDLAYKPLTDPAVYRRGSSGAQTSLAGSAIYDVIPSIHVVSSATSLSPQYALNSNATGSTYQASGTTRVEYHYSEARIAGGGRGFLGFREVASYDPQSGMLTRTRYHQDFPFIGLPEATRSWFLSADPWPSTGAPNLPAWVEASCAAFSASWNSSGKIFLGCSENTWSERATIAGLTHPYLAKSEEWSFNPSYSGASLTGSAFTHRVVTENSGIDIYGNVGQVAVSTYTSLSGTGSRVARQATVNTYTNNASLWHLGRLSCSTVSSTRGSQTITRRSTFGYIAATGILMREVVNASSCSDTSGSLKTTYTLDGFGNRRVTTVTGGDIGPARKTRSLYDSRGRFVNTEQVWLGGAWRTARQVTARDRYGNATQVKDAQGVTATAGFDAMGRPHYSYTPDGAWTRVLHRTGGHSYCPSGTVTREQTTASDGSQSWVCKDKLGRETRTVVWGFDGERINTDTRYDYASRPVEVSEPYKTGQTAYFTRTVYDEVGRVEVVRTPDPANGNPDQHWSYTEVGPGIIRTTHTNVKGRLHRTDRNALGEKITEIAADGGSTSYAYDALGQLTSTDGPLSGTSDKVVIEYDEALGHKERLVDPDKGTWDYQHNALGELTCQIDAKGQGTKIVYDELGRRTIRRDRTGVSNLATCAGTTVGTTTWTYGATAQTASFGQLIDESSQYNDAEGANHTTTRDYAYDNLGRLEQIDTTIAEAGSFNRSYTEQTTYDQFGRVFQQFDAAGGNRGTRFVYNSQGYLEQLREARGGSNSQVYWTVLGQDARGQTTLAEFGNGIEMSAIYEPATGRLEHKIDSGGAVLAQDLEMVWDAMGNLKRRHDRGGMRDQLERFFYDDRERLFRTDRSFNGGAWQLKQNQKFDLSGNIICKSDVSAVGCAQAGSGQNYFYTAAGPHAVTEAGSRTFIYDANGNVTSDRNSGITDRVFEYTSYDKARRISRGNRHIEFHYGADRSRTLRLERTDATVTQRTHYVGSVEVVYEGASPGPNAGEYRRYIGGVAIATFFKATGIDRTRYQHTDHLGSLTALSDEGGQIAAQMSFDPWGQRRDGNDWDTAWQQWAMGITPAWAQSAIDITPRGFTGHEHVDEMGIIHMNGRIYDAHLGRFLQADPFVEDSTTLNRYTYVHNNPLSLTDPSGFFSFKKAFRTIVSVAVAVAAGILTAGAGFSLSGFLYATLGGALSGGIAAGSIEGALWGAFSGAVFFGIGAGFNELAGPQGTGVFGTGLRKSQFALQSVSHGLAGGTIAEMQGGKFGHGFLSAGVSKAATPGVGANIEGTFQQGFVLAIVGGTTSEISGGKFSNGAVTAAMAFAFNEVASRDQRGRGARAGRQGRGEAPSEELPPTICSDDSCIGYTWVSDEMPVSGVPRPFWLGTDTIPDHRWSSIMPPYMGRNWALQAMDLAVDVQVAREPGRWAYPHRRFNEVRQWHLDRESGSMTSHRDYRFERRYQNGLIYKPIQADQSIIYRNRVRSCIGSDCSVWGN